MNVLALSLLLSQVALPADQTVSSAQRSVKIVAETAGEVRWIVFNAVREVPVDYDDLGKTLRLYPNDLDDVIIVHCVALVSGKMSEPARTIVTVVKNRPQPDPKKPEPTPVQPGQPKRTAAHVTLVVDQPNPSVTNDNGLMKWLSDFGIKSYVVAANSQAAKNIEPGIKQAGGAPCVVVQEASGAVITAARFATVEDVKAIVSPYAK